MKKERIKNLMRYDNRLNGISFNSLSTLEHNILFAIICGMYGQTEFDFDLEALRRLASGSHKPIRKDKISELVNGLIDKVFHNYITERTEKGLTVVHLFRAMQFVYNENKEIVGLRVIIDELARDIFVRKMGNLTITDYDIFASIRSIYIKSIFRLLSQFKSTGIAIFDYDKFLSSISCPESYRQEDIKARILEPTKKVIGDYFKNLDYELIKEYELGRKRIKKIKFTFKKVEYKSEVSEMFKTLELDGKDYKELKMLNNALEIVDSLDSSAEQAIISSQLYSRKKRMLRDKGFYNELEKRKENKYKAVNDLSNKMKRTER